MGGIGNKLPLLNPGLFHGTDGQLRQKDGDEQEAQEGENRHQKADIEEVPQGAQCAGNVGEYQNVVYVFGKAVSAVITAEVAESVFIDDAGHPC